MTYPPAAVKVHNMLAASSPRKRSGFFVLMPDAGQLRRAIAVLKAGGLCFSARDPECPQRVLYWPSAEARDAWVKSKGGAA